MIGPGLVSSAAYEIQLTADCELPRFDTRGSWSFWGFFSEERDETVGRAEPTRPLSGTASGAAGAARGLFRGGLQKAADCFAGYAEADDLARGIDVGDRVGRDQAAMA